MKKDILKVCILSITLFIISSATIINFGNTYTTDLMVIDNECKIDVESDTGEIEILKIKKNNDKCIVTIKSKKHGKAYLKTGNEIINEYKYLYIHKSMVITDNNYFGKSTYSEIIPISIIIIILYTLYLIIKRYRLSIKENLYQYKNIAYMGIIIFLSIFLFDNIRSIFNYQGIFETINSIINSITAVSIYLFPIALITSVFVTISNIKLIKKEGLSLKNILGLLLGVFFCISTILPEFVYGLLLKSQKINLYNLNTIGPYAYDYFTSLIYLSVAYLECILIGTIIIALKAVRKKINYNKDYIIILGCKIKEDGTLTPLLKGRVDKAIEFRNQQLKENKKDLIFVPSGGKGKDEVISEAEAIKNYLLEQGIKEKNIVIENKSKNTYENIKYSNKLINNKNANICFSTTNYHVLRAGLIATEQNLKLEGIGSKTKTYFWINAFIREFIGTLYREKKKHITVVILISIVLLLMIGVTYFANNI